MSKIVVSLRSFINVKIFIFRQFRHFAILGISVGNMTYTHKDLATKYKVSLRVYLTGFRFSTIWYLAILR